MSEEQVNKVHLRRYLTQTTIHANGSDVERHMTCTSHESQQTLLNYMVNLPGSLQRSHPDMIDQTG